MFRIVNAFAYDKNGDPIDNIKRVIVKPNNNDSGAKVKVVIKANSEIRNIINNSVSENKTPILNRIIGNLEGLNKRVELRNVHLIIDRQLPSESGLSDELMMLRGVADKHSFVD
ncbi:MULTISPECIES: hypothetical protein [Brevibacillus]|uniref:hypothetical protein n=1 Tax=Brevibacillus TaxID=55080 RepID=UPI000CE4AD32|nr:MULTISPECIES: hypothetical protein [Brevibacillus]MCG7317621.1 hypothetical protein [Brevibacillus laterosporus]MED1789084.1 hypothetical protein [Brevibacillus laterosporus]PPA87645.1 hypothetical protein C4A75_00035 [Brevibacillus laterosporus]RFB34951.1 hypothetical protein DZB91_10505 [Brevibacillus sp. VP]